MPAGTACCPLQPGCTAMRTCPDRLCRCPVMWTCRSGVAKEGLTTGRLGCCTSSVWLSCDRKSASSDLPVNVTREEVHPTRTRRGRRLDDILITRPSRRNCL